MLQRALLSVKPLSCLRRPLNHRDGNVTATSSSILRWFSTTGVDDPALIDARLQVTNTPLSHHDPALYKLLQQEKNRQWKSLELIASENFTSRAVMECLGSCLTNKYAEGLPGARYYGGTAIIDQIETLCQTRALAAYDLDPAVWGVNVQPYSGSPANFATYTALLKPHDRIMGLDLPSGGHLTHGYYTYSKKEKTRKAVSATSVYFESLPYQVHASSGLLDMETLASTAALFKPALLICGGSAYPREWPYAAFRTIADAHGSLLMCDMSHISGLIASKEADSPFDYADVVTSTTHKSLAGPRSGLIFYKHVHGPAINAAVFPALQGGPHQHQIAAVATQLHYVTTPGFQHYSRQVKANAAALGKALSELGYTLATGGTDNHLLLWDLRPTGLSGSKFEKLAEAVAITVNKNTLLGDRSARVPGGVRLGSPALTSRGFTTLDFITVAELLHEAVKIGITCQAEASSHKMTAFMTQVNASEAVVALRARVIALTTTFDMPGCEVATMTDTSKA